MSTENQMHLIGEFRRSEARAAATITPGMLLEFDSAGKLKAHATEGGDALLIFAEVDALQGNTLDDDYSAADLVSANIEKAGNDVQAFLKVDENVAIGDQLISAGDGSLIANGSEASGTTVKRIVAIAREALDLTGSGDVKTLMRVTLL